MTSTSTSESSSTSPPSSTTTHHPPFPSFLPHGYYRITAVAARPNRNTPLQEIQQSYALGEFGRRHNGKFFCHCSYCCNKCNGTTFIKLTRVHEDGIPTFLWKST